MTLVERLRENADQMDDQDSDYNQSRPLLREAANTIDSLLARIAELEKENDGLINAYDAIADSLAAVKGRARKEP